MTDQTAPSLHYNVSVNTNTNHVFDVTLVIDNLDSDVIELDLPAWIPGSYMIRDFAKNIGVLTAFTATASTATASTAATSTSDNVPCSVTKLDKQTWQISGCKNRVEVRYQVYAYDLSVRSAYLNNEFGFFNGTSLFLRVNGLESTPVSLTIEKPSHDFASTWKLATSLARQSGQPFSFGEFLANDYDDLIDHPVLIGKSRYSAVSCRRRRC